MVCPLAVNRYILNLAQGCVPSETHVHRFRPSCPRVGDQTACIMHQMRCEYLCRSIFYAMVSGSCLPPGLAPPPPPCNLPPLAIPPPPPGRLSLALKSMGNTRRRRKFSLGFTRIRGGGMSFGDPPPPPPRDRRALEEEIARGGDGVGNRECLTSKSARPPRISSPPPSPSYKLSLQASEFRATKEIGRGYMLTCEHCPWQCCPVSCPPPPSSSPPSP